MLMWLHVVVILRRRGTNINASGNQRRNDLVAPGGGLSPGIPGKNYRNNHGPFQCPRSLPDKVHVNKYAAWGKEKFHCKERSPLFSARPRCNNACDPAPLLISDLQQHTPKQIVRMRLCTGSSKEMAC